MMMQGMGNMMGACIGGLGSMTTFMGAFWVAVIAGLVYIARLGGRGPQLTTAGGLVVRTNDAALTILRDRFARGELDRAEYEERRQALTSDDVRWP